MTASRKNSTFVLNSEVINAEKRQHSAIEAEGDRDEQHCIGNGLGLDGGGVFFVGCVRFGRAQGR